MRKEIMVLGLAGLLGTGCEDKYDVSRVEQNNELTKPAECETVKDIRLEKANNGYSYQLFCSDKDGNLMLYDRHTTVDTWRKITVK